MTLTKKIAVGCEVSPERVFLNEREVAARYACSRKVIQKWRWQGNGPRYHKLAGMVRYALADLEKYEADSSRGSTSDGPEIVSRPCHTHKLTCKCAHSALSMTSDTIPALFDCGSVSSDSSK